MAEKIEDGYSVISVLELELGNQVKLLNIESKVEMLGTVMEVDFEEEYLNLKYWSKAGQKYEVSKLDFDQVRSLQRLI